MTRALAIGQGGRLGFRLSILALLLASGIVGCASRGSVHGSTRAVAVTIDDLPLAAAEIFPDAEYRRQIVVGLSELIRERSLPATGFFNMAVDAAMPGLVPLWKQAGIEFGNHTWSHPDLQEVGPTAFIEDLRRGHEAVRGHLPAGQLIPFRYPFLSEGGDPAARSAVRAALAELGSPVAPVTILTRDWYFSTGYSRARMGGDAEAAEHWVQGWRWDMQESTLAAEALSKELFDREPPQILLIHANEISAHHLGEYLDWMGRRGYRFISLAEALADPAYREPDLVTSPQGELHWVRLRRSRALAANRQGLGLPIESPTAN